MLINYKGCYFDPLKVSFVDLYLEIEIYYLHVIIDANGRYFPIGKVSEKEAQSFKEDFVEILRQNGVTINELV